jgi:PAS domain S-box-containing protein
MIRRLIVPFRTPHFDDLKQRRQARLLNMTLNSTLLVLPLLIISLQLENRTPLFTILLDSLFAAAILGLRLLLFKRRLLVVGVFTVIVGTVFTTAIVASLGTIRTPPTMVYLVVIVIAGMLFERKGVILTAGFTAIAIWLLIVAENAGWLSEPDYAVGLTQWITLAAIISVTGVLVSLALDALNEALQRGDRLYHEAQAALQRETQLNQLARQLSSTLDTPELANRVLEASVAMLKAEAGNLALFERGSEKIFEYFHLNFKEEWTRIQPVRGQGITGLVYHSNQGMLLDDYPAHPAAVPAFVQGGVTRVVAVPLQVGGQVIGVLALLRLHAAPPFTSADLALAQAIADQAVLGIENAYLYSLAQGELIERRRAESALRESEALYRHAIDAADAAAYYYDFASHRYLFIGEAVERMTGMKREEITPDGFFARCGEAILRGEAAEYDLTEAVRLFRAGHLSEWTCDTLFTTLKGEQRWISDAAVLTRDENGKPVASIGILQDITERKMAEANIRRINDALELRVRERTAQLDDALRQLEEISYSISHDLRSPLRAIDGYSAILAEEFSEQLAEAGMEYIRQVRSSTQRLGLLFDDLVTLLRVSRSDMVPQLVSLTQLAEQVAEGLYQSDPHRQVEMVIQDGLSAHGDHSLLQIVLQNLFFNAWKFSASNLQAKIEFGQQEHGPEQVYFVRDNGIGFEMAYAGKLFQPFQRLHTDPELVGTGIGLATVQRIITRHGGRVWAEGAPGKGAVFYFTLPALQAAPTAFLEKGGG